MGITTDPTNNVVYFTTGGGRFLRYNTESYSAGGTYPTSNNCYAPSGNYANNIGGALTYDPNEKVVYMTLYDNSGGGGLKVYRHNTTFYTPNLSPTYPAANTTYAISSKFTSGNTYPGLKFDPANNVLYLGAGSGLFFRYQTTSWTGSGTCAATGQPYAADASCELTAKINSFWAVNGIYSIALDAASNNLFLGGASGKFAKFDMVGEVATNLRSPDKIAFIATDNINSLTLDSANGVVYIGGDSGKFGKYTISSDTGADLTSRISASTFWTTNSVKSVVFNLTGGDIYLGGVGLYKSTAEKIAKEIEILMLIKYSI